MGECNKLFLYKKNNCWVCEWELIHVTLFDESFLRGDTLALILDPIIKMQGAEIHRYRGMSTTILFLIEAGKKTLRRRFLQPPRIKGHS